MPFSLVKNRNVNKKSQVTIFVIIAIVLVIAIILFFSLNKKISLFQGEVSLTQSLSSCVDTEVNNMDSQLLRQGGVSAPQHYLLVNGDKVSYLCYTEEYAKACVNQQPLLKENMERELASLSYANVSSCISKEKTRLEKKGYSVSVSNFKQTDLKTKLLPGKILIQLNLDFTSSKGDKTEKIAGFETSIKSPAYDYAFLTNKIISAEIEGADFNNMLYMLLHRSIIIDKVRSNDYILYKLQNRNSDKVFIFLIRNYPIPAGL